MRFFRLILNNTLRHKLRTVLTIVAVAIAILAFGFIRTAISAWYVGVTASAPDRLITRSKISITFTLPLAQKERIERIPGVVAVTHGTWFGGIYKDPQNFFPQFAMENVESFKLYPEFIIDTAALRAFATERNAVIVGVKTMERFGWKLGDVVHLTGTIYPGDWDFVIRGIYTGRSEVTDASQFIFNWNYIEQRLQRDWPERAGQVGWWVIKIDDPAKSASISAAVDKEFDNSADETITETEAAFQQSFVAMSGTIILSLQIVSFMVAGIILLVAANTMAMTARERISEYAVLKTLGFGGGRILGLIAGESVLIAGLGGVLGIMLLFPVLHVVATGLRAYFPAFPIDWRTYPLSAAVAVVVGFVAAIFPAWRAVRLPIVSGLRRTG